MNAFRQGVSLTLVTILAAAIAAQAARAREDNSVTGRFGDDLFMAGGMLRTDGVNPGDLIMAGGRIATSGAVRGDQVSAGGELDLRANIDGGLYAAGGRVRLDGKVGRNVRIAGGMVEVGPEGDVQGGLTIAGGGVEVDGRVGKYLQISAGRVGIDGHVGGNVDVASGVLDVGPSAVVDGTLTYYGPHPATVAAGAQIRGGIQYVERGHHGGPTAMLRGFGIRSWLWLIGWMVIGSVVLALWPGFSRSVTDTALRRPGMALLIGFAVLVCVPVAAVLLLVSIIGIPLALLAICLYLVLLPLGYLASAATLGDWVVLRTRGVVGLLARERILMLLGALVLLFVLTRIPVLGGIVGFLVIVAGVGSLVMAVTARYRQA